jgi:hypothetical protein
MGRKNFSARAANPKGWDGGWLVNRVLHGKIQQSNALGKTLGMQRQATRIGVCGVNSKLSGDTYDEVLVSMEECNGRVHGRYLEKRKHQAA